MAIQNGFGVSPVTNIIYYGMMDDEKHIFVGEKTDVTHEAIRAVYEWFIRNMENEDEEFSVSYPGGEFELVMRRNEKKWLKAEKSTTH